MYQSQARQRIQVACRPRMSLALMLWTQSHFMTSVIVTARDWIEITC